METISPPSSPEPAYARRAGQETKGGQRYRDVSPIDDDRRGAAQPPRSSSRNGGDSRTNIPMMRRARRKQSDAALREAQARERQASNPASGQQQRGEVRWDTMTGEPTASAAGRPPQVRPAEYAQGLGISTGSSPPQRSPSAMMTAFGDRVRRMRHSSRGDKKPETAEHDTDPAANAFASSRPGWRGASGRTAIVEPVRDNLQVAPLKIAPKNPKRVVSPTAATSPASAQPLERSMRGQTPPVSPPGAETAAGSRSRETIRKVVPSSQLATPAEPKHESRGPSYPSPPLSGSFDRSDAPSVAAKQLQSSITSENPAGSQQALDPTTSISRKPPLTHAHQESVSSVYSQASHAPPPPPAHSANPGTLAPGDPWAQPASRFSITTYATSAADNTPRESLDDFDHTNNTNRPPVPDTPLQYRDSPHVPARDNAYMSSPFQQPPPPPSAAAQQRAAAAAGTTTTSIHPALRGTAPAPAPRTTADRPSSIASSINKSLPPAPPETSAGENPRDRVAMLNARLQGLGNRRINITRSIKQMTELMPAGDGLFERNADVARRREEERRKVEVLRDELAEVRREEYELGLRLHRAYKRMEREDNFEGTALWVRRVTG